jgi:hypothetical protein
MDSALEYHMSVLHVLVHTNGISVSHKFSVLQTKNSISIQVWFLDENDLVVNQSGRYIESAMLQVSQPAKE